MKRSDIKDITCAVLIILVVISLFGAALLEGFLKLAALWKYVFS